MRYNNIETIVYHRHFYNKIKKSFDDLFYSLLCPRYVFLMVATYAYK